MTWKTAYRSIYYDGAPEPADPDLAKESTNLGIKTVVCCGIFTDQCVSSTVRSLADESFGVVVVEDCCAAASNELHRNELEIINMIYCHVMSSAELKEIMGLGLKS